MNESVQGTVYAVIDGWILLSTVDIISGSASTENFLKGKGFAAQNDWNAVISMFNYAGNFADT